MSLRDHFHSLRSFFKFHLFQLNLFISGHENELILQRERRSTRLYLLLLLISITIIAFYYSVIPYTNTLIIKSPSFLKYTILSKENTLECPCTTIAVPYEDFVQLEPFYDQLCQSDFISNEYINQLYLFYEPTWNSSNSLDFYRTAVFQFKTLRTLCQLTQQTIEYTIKTFLQADFVQSQLISERLFNIQMTSLLDDFIDMTPKDFLRTLHFIQDITAQNLFMTGASVTSILPIVQYQADIGESIGYLGKNYLSTDGSICICSSSTATTCMGLTIFQNATVPGFLTGCYMFNALLHSTLGVFYNQTFVNQITNSTNRFQQLNSSISNSSSTVERLLSQMFVTHWSNKTSFEQYFNRCAPNFCQYTITEHYDFVFILTTLIGLCGGLSSALRLIVPILIMTIWPWIWKFITRRQTPVTHIIDIEVQRGSRIDHFKELIQEQLIELNFFGSIPPSQHDTVLRQQRYTTRIYLILLFLTLIILILFTSIQPQTIRVVIQSPSLTDFIQLYDRYSITLQCPCTQTTIEQELIVHIQPQYHQICTSDFISSNWIDLSFVRSSSLQLITRDIRYQSQFHFQLLATLCSMANQTIQDSLQSFYKTNFITNQVLHPRAFQLQIDLTMEQFQRTVPESFQRTLNLLKTNFEINQFITPMNSWFSMPRTYDDYYLMFRFIPFLYQWAKRPGCDLDANYGCDCVSLSTYPCYRETMINESGNSLIIPGMFQTWFPLQALLISTLECFYNQSCLSQITSFINSTQRSINFTTLSENNNPYERIDILVNNLFIQSWNNQTSFQSYFNHCHPSTCQYTYETRLNLLYMIATILGLIGGLNVVLRLSLPVLVQSLMKISNSVFHNQQQNHTISTSRRVRHHAHTLFRHGKQTINEWNLFATIPPSQDPKIIHRNRQSTRIYLMLLMATLFILILYTFVRQETMTITIKSPSLLKYKELFSEHPFTLQCSCTHTAIKYNQLISQLQPEYHSICTSVFTSRQWIESMPDMGGGHLLLHFESDFQSRLRLYFETLSNLCILSRNTLNTSLTRFGQTDFITAYVISNDEFNIRTEAIIEQFKRTTSDQFAQTFKLIQALNEANQLASLFSSDWIFFLSFVDLYEEQIGDVILKVVAQPKTYNTNNCSCGRQLNCTQPWDFRFRTSNQSLRESLPGFLDGCLPFDSLLQSNLICFYNQTCVDILRATTSYSKPIPYEILSYSSISMANLTIETLLSQLFVAQWFHQTSFDIYFNECASESCQYSYTRQYNPIYVVTTLIALFGGLTKGLHFLVDYVGLILFKMIDYRKKKKKNNQVGSYSHPQSNGDDIEMITNPRITTVKVEPEHSVEEPISSRRRDQAMIICLILLVICVIISAAVIVFINQHVDEKVRVTSTQTTLLPTSSLRTELTSTSTEICYMTLKYQSKSYSIGLGSTSLITGDFNQDFIVDLAVTNADSDTISVLRGNRNGSFQTQQIYATGNGSSPRDLTTADFNNDGLLDLAVVLYGTHEIMIFFGVIATNIRFRLPPYSFSNYTHVYRPELIAVSDLNNDGLIDLIVITNSNKAIGSSQSIFLLNQNKTKTFDAIVPSIFSLSTSILSIIVGDFTNHGQQNDIGICNGKSVVTTYSKRNYSYAPNYKYAKEADSFMYEYPSILIKGHFNDDELEDLAVISSRSDTLQVLLAYGDKYFTQQIYLTQTYPTSIARLNYNNDSIDDLAILNCHGTIVIFLGTKIGIFHRTDLSFQTTSDSNGKCYHSLKVADLNQDGKDDLVFIDANMNSIRVLLSSDCKT